MKTNEPLLALDFDGVICDSIDECLLTSYNAFYELEIDNVSKIPDDIRTYFYKYRNYVRPAREYYLIHKAYNKNLQLMSFVTFNKLEKQYRNESKLFEKHFYKMRNYLKKDEENWLSLHRIYDHIREFFLFYNKKFFIVTNKDKDSIETLSEYFGFRKFIWDIYSKELSIKKEDLFNMIFLNYRKHLENNKLVYVDDNEWHLADIQHLTIEIYFAKWGYSGKQIKHSFNEIKGLNDIFYIRSNC